MPEAPRVPVQPPPQAVLPPVPPPPVLVPVPTLSVITESPPPVLPLPAPALPPAVVPASGSQVGGQRSQDATPAPVVTAPVVPANPAPAADNAYSELSDADYGRISSHLAPHIKRSYSRRANLRGWQGSVTVSFLIKTEGEVADVRVTKSSGYDELDECAVAAVRKAAPYPPLGREVRLLLPVTYKLR